VDGETCIIWRDFDELRHKLDWYAAREDDRARVAAAGERLAVERHSFDARVRELLSMKPGGVEDWR
jgi:spore maturation protein CgeB